MSLRTNLTVIQAIEVVRTDGFTMTATAHGIDANEQDAIARYVAFNAADGKVVFEQCGYKWRSSPWRDSLFIHYLEEPSKRINLLCVDTNRTPRDPWPKKFLGKFFEKLLIAGLVEGAKKGIENSYRHWDTNENRIRTGTFSFEPPALSRAQNHSITAVNRTAVRCNAMFAEKAANLRLLRNLSFGALLIQAARRLLAMISCLTQSDFRFHTDNAALTVTGSFRSGKTSFMNSLLLQQGLLPELPTWQLRRKLALARLSDVLRASCVRADNSADISDLVADRTEDAYAIELNDGVDSALVTLIGSEFLCVAADGTDQLELVIDIAPSNRENDETLDGAARILWSTSSTGHFVLASMYYYIGTSTADLGTGTGTGSGTGSGSGSGSDAHDVREIDLTAQVAAPRSGSTARSPALLALSCAAATPASSFDSNDESWKVGSRFLTLSAAGELAITALPTNAPKGRLLGEREEERAFPLDIDITPGLRTLIRPSEQPSIAQCWIDACGLNNHSDTCKSTIRRESGSFESWMKSLPLLSRRSSHNRQEEFA